MEMKLHVAALLLAHIVLADAVYQLPPIRCVTTEDIHEQFLADGKMLMNIKCIPDESETLVCTNWFCPTSIVVNAMQYSLVTDNWMGVISVDVMSAAISTGKVAYVKVYQEPNAKEARRSVFAGLVQSDVLLPADFAPRIIAMNLDPMTNMMYVTDTKYGGTNYQFVVYRNLCVFVESPTNGVDFATAIINAGLPESERIVLP